ncbi:MAG: sugar ABC transporter permease [Clostridia bacterium]
MTTEKKEKAILAEENTSTEIVKKKAKKVKKDKISNQEMNSPLAVPTAKRFLTFERRKAVWGYIFISPWILGVILFFIFPMIQSIMYTFSEITVKDGFQMKFIGLENYMYFFQKDTFFIKETLVPSILNMLWQVPIVIIFSLFVAMLIKEKFFGRTLARAIFFLPVIISSGVVLGILKQNILGGQTIGGMDTQAAYMFSAPSFSELFSTLGVPTEITLLINTIVGQVFDLTWKSGVQILLLLAAVNNIPASQYEVADMEGATGWEKFWKITFPMVSPTLLVTLIYTVIDSFTDFQNPVMTYMMQFISKESNYQLGTTVAVIYFVCVLVIIGIVNAIVSRHVFYYND